MADNRDAPVPVDRLVASVRKNSREEIRIALREYRGHRFIDMRLYAANASGELVATARGFGVRGDNFQQFADALAEAHSLAIAEGFFNG